jgi:aspartate racemase
MHPEVSMIPFIHIAEAVAGEATKRGYTSVGLTGTKYLMTSPVYPVVLDGVGIECMVPDRGEREQIDFIIFKELVNGIFPEESRLYLNEVIGKFRARGAEAVILGCTEIPLIVRPDDCPLPTLDSTRLLARAALARVFSGEPSIGV